jgi:transcriptional regulator with XRE-family HTH domain
MTARLANPVHMGAIVARLRHQRGLSRTQLATTVAGTTGQTIDAITVQLSRWERGLVRTPDFGTLLPVLDALGYDLALIPREDA